MQISLAESSARTRPSPWVGASLVAHAAAVSLLLLRGTTPQEYFPPMPEVLTYVETRQDPAPPPVTPDNPPESFAEGGAPVVRIPVLDVPVVVPQTTVDLPISPADFDPSLFEQRGLVSTLASARTIGRPAAGGVHDASTVDRAVQPLSGNPAPAYPPALSAAGIEGEVAVHFVVDISGRVEKGSVRIIRATHALFEREVRAALERMRFLPAESGGAKVRQLVEQVFRFEINRRGGGADGSGGGGTDGSGAGGA